MGWMNEAIQVAKKGLLEKEVPVGAIIVYKSQIISAFHNQVEALKSSIAHAELLAIYEAQQKLGIKYLSECDLYVTLEPCPMCAYALCLARIQRIYFGAYDPKNGGIDHGSLIFNTSFCHHKPEIIGGIKEMECMDLLKEFFKSKR